MLGIDQIIMRLVVSAILGGIIGIERESSNRPAGFRTHILVTLGSALMMIISTTSFDPFVYNNDPMRLAAQVVSGVGFLGAGTVLKDGDTVKGLTTAAAIWVCGGIGLAIGVGMYEAGIIATLISFFSLTILNKIEKEILSQKIRKSIQGSSKRSMLSLSKLVLTRDTDHGFTKDIEDLLLKFGYYADEISILYEDEDEEYAKIIITIAMLDADINMKNLSMRKFMLELKSLPGVKKVRVEY